MRAMISTLRSRVLSSGATAEGKNIVAFSGGVDSSLVAALVHQAFPNNSLACVGVSAALPAAQLQLARSVAGHIGEEYGATIVDKHSAFWRVGFYVRIMTTSRPFFFIADLRTRRLLIPEQ